jgi:hypothetical protein
MGPVQAQRPSWEAFSSYIEAEKGLLSRGTAKFRLRCLFERAIAKFSSYPALWVDYLDFLVRHYSISVFAKVSG